MEVPRLPFAREGEVCSGCFGVGNVVGTEAEMAIVAGGAPKWFDGENMPQEQLEQALGVRPPQPVTSALRTTERLRA